MKLADTITLGDKIILFRQAKRWTQAELAEGAGLSAAALASYETGRRRATIDVVEQIAAALGISVADFYNDDIWQAFQDAFIIVTALLLGGVQVGHRGRPLPPIEDTPILPAYVPAAYHDRVSSRRTRPLRMTGKRLRDPRARY